MQQDVHHFLSCDGDCPTCLQGWHMLGYDCQHVVEPDPVVMRVTYRHHMTMGDD